MGRLDGKVAAVTGRASGIGEAMVRRFLAEGASSEPIGETLAELPFTGDQAVCLGHDKAAAVSSPRVQKIWPAPSGQQCSQISRKIVAGQP
jgi:NAD(P)-dependent dehydrogenase (short-subunit alcohol dehydrogenase family)